VWMAQALDESASKEPGKVQNISPRGIDIATVDGVLRLLELQKAGGKRQAVAAFVRGWQAEL
jgi:methionyl-tRNA formyltransferase